MGKIFFSLKTTVWTTFVLVLLFFIGSFAMPMHKEVFASMNETILFGWITHIAAHNIADTWWFFAVLAALIVLTINTLACSIQAVRGRWSRTDFLLRVSPQIIHAGFLFILFGHFLSAGWGYKLSGVMPEGAYAPLPDDRALFLKAIHIETDASGDIENWAAEASVFENNKLVKNGILGPNMPIFYGGVGIYLKSLSVEKGPSGLLVIAKDPGAGWALFGGILFMIGAGMLLVFKWNKT